MRKTRQNKTAEEYRQLAEKCRESARTVSAENERIELLARAHTWDRTHYWLNDPTVKSGFFWKSPGGESSWPYGASSMTHKGRRGA
jgi:hypothetical protein